MPADGRVCGTANAGLALGAAALLCSAPASAQNNVVVQPPAQPAPAPQPAPAQPAPNNVVVTSPGVTQAQPPSTTVVVPAQPEPVAEQAIHPANRPNRFLLMTGLVLFGAPYVASVGIGAASPHQGDANLYVPLAGPWLDLAARPGCPANSTCNDETGDRVLLVGDGVLQTIGALEVIGAFVFPETIGVASVGSKDSSTAVSFTPSKVGRDGYGLSAVGWF